MNADTPLPSGQFHAVRLKNYMAALERMKAETQHMLTELEARAPPERENPKPERSNIMQMYLSRLGQSTEARCQNLRATLNAIERERLSVQNELDVAVLESKT